MAVSLRTRYGASQSVTNPAKLEPKIRELVDELCEEQFARPDYEHSEVSVSHPNGWYIAAMMSGVIVLGQMDGPPDQDRYLYGLSKDDLVNLFLTLAEGRVDEIVKRPWSADLKAVRGRGDHYLFLNSPDMTDLHRAAAKGDCDWIRSELKAGADIDGRDKDGATPLHTAALAGQVEACHLLVDAGADLSATDADGADVVEYAELSREYIGATRARELAKYLSTRPKRR